MAMRGYSHDQYAFNSKRQALSQLAPSIRYYDARIGLNTEFMQHISVKMVIFTWYSLEMRGTTNHAGSP